jgi:thiol-disulfide isomerase/thioredoxin
MQMPTELTLIARHVQVSWCVAVMVALASLQHAAAQETDDKSAPVAAAETAADQSPGTDASQPTEENAPTEEVDPYAVPADATAEQLFKFIQSVKRLPGKTRETVSKSARAAVAGAEAIRRLEEVEIEIEIKAIREQLDALGLLQRIDYDSSAQLQSLIDELKNDQRDAIARIGAIEAFKITSRGARSASKPQQLKMVAELKELLSGHEFDRESYRVATGLARAIGYSDHAEVAASLYEDLARRVADSSDKTLQERADKMLGAARRMRLPGDFMEVMGSTTSGEDFDWNAYRGKVVLVDFWASWCIPCRAEVPNMKRNLAAYADRGFDIVGVNLDRTLRACEKYVERKELAWTNLMSDKEGERGWDNPLATYYGISAIPTAILVDQEGKVVSLKARGSELDRLLAEILGPPAPSEENPESKVAKKLAENDN